MRYEFGGLIFGGAYFRNFTLLFLRIKMICKLSYSLKGVFLANLGWIKTRQLYPKRDMVNGEFSAKLAITNSTLNC